MGIDIPPSRSLPIVEPGPPTDKYGPTRAFDSDYNALLPEAVLSLASYRVMKVVGGAGHTVFMVVPEGEGGEGEEEEEGGRKLCLEGGMEALAITDGNGSLSTATTTMTTDGLVVVAASKGQFMSMSLSSLLGSYIGGSSRRMTEVTHLLFSPMVLSSYRHYLLLPLPLQMML